MQSREKAHPQGKAPKRKLRKRDGPAFGLKVRKLLIK